jgi:HEAT repeat protein
MGRSGRLEDRLAALDELRSDPSSSETLGALRKALTLKTNHVVARAAEIAGEFGLVELEADLVRAFDRFMVNATKTDPTCAAKAAIVDALYRMDAYQADVYLRGIGHVQLEPVWGGRQDTAAALRGSSALALVRINYPNVMLLLAQLLADPEADARIAAARAIGYAGLPEGIPLLRFKALTGDPQPTVLYEAFSALLSLSPDASLSFVAGFLHRDDTGVQQAAALALGESHMVQAFPFLEAAWEDAPDGDLRRGFLLAIALLRQERAIRCLIALVEGGGQAGEDALTALSMYRGEPRIWRDVEAALGRVQGKPGRFSEAPAG